MIQLFDPWRVRPLPDQPRKRFSGIEELAASIKAVGQTCPGLVTPVNDHSEFEAQLVDGERRLRACTMAGVQFRAEVRPNGTRDEILAVSFASNFCKQEHDPIEIATALNRLVDACKTQDEIACIVGRSACWVNTHLQLLQLHPSVQAMMIPKDHEEKPILAFTQGHELAKQPESVQIKVAEKIKAKGRMSKDSIRELIHHEMDVQGRPRQQLPESRKGSFHRLIALLNTFEGKINYYIDLPGPSFNARVDQLDTTMRRHLAEKLEDLAEGLKGMEGAVKSRIHSAGKVRA